MPINSQRDALGLHKYLRRFSLCDISQSRSPERQENSFAFSFKYIFLCSARKITNSSRFSAHLSQREKVFLSFARLLASVIYAIKPNEIFLSRKVGKNKNSSLGRRRDFREESNSSGHFPLIRIFRAEAKNCLLRHVFLLMTTNVIRLLMPQTTTSFLLNIKISVIQVSEMSRNLPMEGGRRRRRPIIELNI